MISNLFFDLNWFLITIDDEYLTGISIFKMLKFIQVSEKVNYVIFDDILGFSEAGIIGSLREDIGEIYEIDKFLEIILKIEHFEWGDFFLFEEYPKGWDSAEVNSLPVKIARTDFTLRAVDDQYMYIYTKRRNFIDMVEQKYEIESVKQDLLDRLDFPT